MRYAAAGGKPEQARRGAVKNTLNALVLPFGLTLQIA
jgi:hypothetical protein